MSSSMSALVDILEEQEALYAELVSLSMEQREALVARRCEDLSRIAARQSRLLTHVAYLDGRAGTMAETLAEDLGAGDANVSAIASLLPDADGRALCVARDRLLASADQLSAANTVNEALCESALDAINYTLQWLATDSRGPQAGYPGAPTPLKASALLLDQKA